LCTAGNTRSMICDINHVYDAAATFTNK